MKMTRTYHKMDPNHDLSSGILEHLQYDFLEWWRREVEPHVDRVTVTQKLELREEALQNFRYSLRVAYNRGFSDSV